jgi:hypothetical protein
MFYGTSTIVEVFYSAVRTVELCSVNYLSKHSYDTQAIMAIKSFMVQALLWKN